MKLGGGARSYNSSLTSLHCLKLVLEGMVPGLGAFDLLLPVFLESPSVGLREEGLWGEIEGELSGVRSCQVVSDCVKCVSYCVKWYHIVSSVCQVVSDCKPWKL